MQEFSILPLTRFLTNGSNFQLFCELLKKCLGVFSSISMSYFGNLDFFYFQTIILIPFFSLFFVVYIFVIAFFESNSNVKSLWSWLILMSYGNFEFSLLKRIFSSKNLFLLCIPRRLLIPLPWSFAGIFLMKLMQ